MRKLVTLASALCMLGAGQCLAAQVKQELNEKLAAVRASIESNQAALRQYTWVEHTDILLKGEVKKTKDDLCRYGPDGTVTKTPVGTPAPEKHLHGIKKRVAEKKVGELKDYMDRAVALIHSYVPPSPEKMKEAFQAGTVSLGQAGPGRIQLRFNDYVKPGDSLTFSFVTATKSLTKIDVASYLDNPKDAVSLGVGFQTLPDGTNYVASTILNAPAKEIQVKVTNSNYQKLAQ